MCVRIERALSHKKRLLQLLLPDATQDELKTHTHTMQQQQHHKHNHRWTPIYWRKNMEKKRRYSFFFPPLQSTFGFGSWEKEEVVVVVYSILLSPTWYVHYQLLTGGGYSGLRASMFSFVKNTHQFFPSFFFACMADTTILLQALTTAAPPGSSSSVCQTIHKRLCAS